MVQTTRGLSGRGFKAGGFQFVVNVVAGFHALGAVSNPPYRVHPPTENLQSTASCSCGMPSVASAGALFFERGAIKTLPFLLIGRNRSHQAIRNPTGCSGPK